MASKQIKITNATIDGIYDDASTGEPEPAPPIVVVPPDSVGPGVPSHPIYMPIYPSHPIVFPPDSIAPGVPSHPIVLPPTEPPYPAHPIVIPPGSIDPGPPLVPEHPIVLPPSPEEPPAGTPPGDWSWAWSSEDGWHIMVVPDNPIPTPSKK